VSTREKIIGLLKEGEKSQVEIYKSLKIARSTASETLSKNGEEWFNREV